MFYSYALTTDNPVKYLLEGTSEYDKALLGAAKEVHSKGLVHDFNNCEYLQIAERWLKTFAVMEENGTWYLKEYEDCKDDDRVRDDFAFTHFCNNIKQVLEFTTLFGNSQSIEVNK